MSAAQDTRAVEAAMNEQYREYQQLWAIGCVRLPAATVAYPVSWRDLEIDARWTRSVVQQMGVERGDLVHISHYYSELAQLWPYYQAVRNLGAIFANGMPSQFDAYRVEMYLRRFRLAAAIGVAADTLTGLEQAGHDPARVYANARVIAAMPDACQRLRDYGFQPWCLRPVGPIYAVEVPGEAGARFDNSEWTVESCDGRLLVSSAPQRACAFQRLDTGIAGTVDKVNGEAGPELRIFLQ